MGLGRDESDGIVERFTSTAVTSNYAFRQAACLCVTYDAQNKQRLSPYTALTGFSSYGLTSCVLCEV